MARTAQTHLIDPLEARRHFAISTGLFPLTSGGPGFDNAQKTVATNDGVYVAGLFSGSVDFAPGNARNVLTARGDTDIYLAKYNPNGSLAWVTQIGGDHTDKAMVDFGDRDVLTNPRRLGVFVGRVGEQPRQAGEYVQDLTVDAAGNVVLVGAFKKTIAVNGFSLTADGSIDDDFYDILIAKFNTSGAPAWTRHVGGPFDDVAMSVGTDAGGNVFVGGYFTRQADFDPSSRVKMLRSEGRDSGFVLRLSDAGAFNWVYQFSNDAVDLRERNAVNDIAVTGSGNVYFVGTYSGRTDFDPSATRRFELRSEGETDAYLGLLNRKGALSWALSTGGDVADGNVAVALGAGAVYTAGYFGDEADVDPRANVTRIYEATPESGRSSPTFSDVLVSRFDLDGTPVWQAQMGGGYIELIADLNIGADGSIYTVGSFFDDADFAPGPSEVILSSAVTNDGSIKDGNTSFGRDRSYDWFISRLSPRGKYVSAARFGGADDDYASGVASLNGQVFLAGRATTARGERDDRNENALVLLLDDNLKRLA